MLVIIVAPNMLGSPGTAAINGVQATELLRGSVSGIRDI